MRLRITEPIADLGTIITFRGLDAEGDPWVVCADHRPAHDILDALAEGETVEVDPEEWQVWRASS